MKLFYSRIPENTKNTCLRSACFSYSFSMPFQTQLPKIENGCIVIGGQIRPCAIPALLHEVTRRGITSVCTGFVPSPPSYVKELCAALQKQHLLCILAEPCWAAGLPCTRLLTGMISGGRWETYLEESLKSYGSIALDLQKTQHLFSLPSPDGQGRTISVEQAAELRKKHTGIFFSQSLMCHALPCITHGSCEFLLLDDGDSLSRKVKLAAEAGVEAGFLLDGEWSLTEAMTAAEKARENPAIHG